MYPCFLTLKELDPYSLKKVRAQKLYPNCLVQNLLRSRTTNLLSGSTVPCHPFKYKTQHISKKKVFWKGMAQQAK